MAQELPSWKASKSWVPEQRVKRKDNQQRCAPRRCSISLLIQHLHGNCSDPSRNVKLVSYAEDCTVLSSGPVISEIETKTNSYLAVLLKRFEENSFELSTGKSSATLFTTFSNESSRTLKIEVESNRIPTEKHPKILGVTFDPMNRFGAHAKTVVDGVAKRNNVLCALTGSSWGKDKELLLTTYKATGRAIINYAAPVWSPGLADSHWQKIQSCQNSAPRSATGCTRMTMEDDIHNETKFLPVRDRRVSQKWFNNWDETFFISLKRKL